MIHLDTSALVKLARREPGTAELLDWLATAQVPAGGLHSFVTYDERLLEAAATSGLPTAAPGA